MHIILPLAGYVLGLSVPLARGSGWRESILLAATGWGVLVVLITELLSIAGWLTKAGLALAWLTIDVAALIYLWQLVRQRACHNSLRRSWAQLQQSVVKLGRADLGLLGGVSVVLAGVGVVALLSPPNTWDAMVYHMPRVVHWIQNRGVTFYPTHDLRQLHMPPWAEFAMLQLHVLFGGDGLDNFVQWFSLLGSVIGVTLLARFKGAGYRGQVLAAVVCGTIPQGLLQASGAKNDYVVAFWLVALAYYLCRFEREPTWTHAAGIGAALGLAWLTKGTTYVFSLAIVLTWVLALPWKLKKIALGCLPLVVVLAIGLNAGHFLRNYSLSGSPLGPMSYGGQLFKFTNDEITFATLSSNVLRNLSLHVGTPSSAVNTTLKQWVEAVIHIFGDDPNNPRTTWSGTSFDIPKASYHEDLAGNPIHLALIMVALVMMVGCGDLRKSRGLVVYAIGLALAFMLFCALLRWQPWNTRLHLPLFVLWSAAIGVILERTWPRRATNILGVLLLLLSVPVVLHNQLRPLAFGKEFNILYRDRVSLYFAGQRDLLDSYRAATEFVKKGGCQNIGLDLPSNSYEYPFLRLLGAGKGDKNVRAVGVTNPSAIYTGDGNSFRPCAVICLQCSQATEKWDMYTSRVGPATVFGPLAVFSTESRFLKHQKFDL